MPKCINDPTKSYKGDEPSPKGLGYCAGKFEPGYQQEGNDGNIWYVLKTTTGNRWTKLDMTKIQKVEPVKQVDESVKQVAKKDSPNKETNESFKITKLKKEKDKVLMCVKSNDKESWQDFDFGKLSEDFYVYAYLPICEKMTEPETGLEEKFGGSFPYLTKNTAPEVDRYNEPFIFLCQFRDPRSEDDSMYQVFVSEDLKDYDIRKIKLDNEAIKKQCKYNIMSELEPYKIVAWKQIKELVSFEKLREKLKFSKEVEKILWDVYFEHPLTPSYEIKVGGSPTTCQATNYDDMDLLQLTDSEFLNFSWGDSGIAHVSTKLHLKWDCC
jgi:hypothetical protein